MKIGTTAMKIFQIRRVMGYSTLKQQTIGVAGEIRFIKNMIKNLKKDMIHSSGGFSYQLSPSGKSVIITPDFKFMLRLKK